MKNNCDLIKKYRHIRQLVYQIFTPSVLEHSIFVFKTYCALVNLVIKLRFKVLGIQRTVHLCLTR